MVGMADPVQPSLTQYGRCGTFCGSCARFHGRPAAAAARFIAIVEGSGTAKSLSADRYQAYPEQVAHQYHEAKRYLTVLKDWLSCWGCGQGGGPRECEIRKCCDERGFKLCFECPEFMGPSGICEKFAPEWLEACNVSAAEVKANHSEWQAHGLDGWIEREAKRTDLGWRSTRQAIRRHIETVKTELAEVEARIQARLQDVERKGGQSG